jgi:hypothetical protein
VIGRGEIDTRMVRDAAAETLLTALEQLTHRIHVAQGDAERDLRAQRLIVRNEIKRRMGDAS